MGNELENNVGNENDNVKVLKKWSTPQMTTVSIATLTEGQAGPSQEANTTTLS
jgi:hypothetical protein